MSSSPSHFPFDAAAGARNLLVGCAGVRAGDSVLLVLEPEGSVHYDPAVAPFIARCAENLGARVERFALAPAGGPESAPPALLHAIESADHTIFLNRIGDQLRFAPLPGKGSKTMCYALDLDFLGSDFAVSPYAVWENIHARVTAKLDAAGEYRIRCPRGTDLSMRLAHGRITQKQSGGFTVKNFPVMIVPPIPASALSGRLVLTQALTSTYVHAYEASVLPLSSPLSLSLENGEIVRLEGDDALVARARQHFERVGTLFGGPKWAVSSWHAGINAFTYFPRPALEDIDRWSSVAFGSPRYAHFHMCGSAPGDICGQIFDPTIAFDGETLWDNGLPAFLATGEKRQLLGDAVPSLESFGIRRSLGIVLPPAPLPG